MTACKAQSALRNLSLASAIFGYRDRSPQPRPAVQTRGSVTSPVSMPGAMKLLAQGLFALVSQVLP